MDNKYANLNLPGIAKNEPDVYETFNSNPAQSRHDPVEDDSANVEKINVSSKEAHDKFNKKTISSDFADFSDTISNRKKFGYVFEPEVFEWNQDPGESPLARFKRLETELVELKRDLAEMEKAVASGEEEKPDTFEPSNLMGEVEKLQKQINSLHLQSIGAGKKVTDLDSKAKKQLLVDYLEEIKKKLSQKQKSVGKEAGKEKDEKQEASIVFKLFADLEKSDLERQNKISELNQRLSNLEKVFGAGNASISESQIAKLCANLENKSIMGFVENLNSRMSLVESQSLDVIESRLQAVAMRVNQLNEKKTVVEDQEKLNRVNELYGLLCNWKDLSVLLPSIVERLASLNELHQKAFEFSSMLSRLDKEQETIKQSVEVGTQALETLKKNFESNLDSIKTNFEHLNERVITIGGKTSKA